jgi:hypothetical protein
MAETLLEAFVVERALLTASHRPGFT